jgi:rhodanese-related sulfurtransferase
MVVVCQSGNRSARATALLTRFGFEAVSLNGGMRAWAAAGLAVETGNPPPTTVV